MLKTGNYIVKFFNRVGARLKDKEAIRETLMASRQQGAYVVKLAENSKSDREYIPTSFTVDLRVFNSLDNNNTWE